MSTISVRRRILHHYNAVLAKRLDVPVRKALAKYGVENVEVDLVPNGCPAETERELIADLRAKGVVLYNATDGGDGTSGFHHSAATRAKMSNAAIQSWSPQRAQKYAAMCKDPDYIARLANSQRLSWTVERRAKMAEFSRRAGLVARCRKLNDDDVREIAAALLNGASCASLGRRYKVTPECISRIKLGRHWVHVTGFAFVPKQPRPSGHSSAKMMAPSY